MPALVFLAALAAQASWAQAPTAIQDAVLGEPNQRTSEVYCGQLRARLLGDGVVPGDIPNPYDIPWFFMFREEILKESLTRRYGASRGEVQSGKVERSDA